MRAAMAAGLVLACGACDAPTTKTTEATPAPSIAAPVPTPGAPQVGVYRGLLACADCPGIAATLTLHPPPHYGFRLERADPRAPSPMPVLEGQYFILRGNAVDPDATVFELKGPDETLFLHRITDNELKSLDAEQRPIPTSPSMTRASGSSGRATVPAAKG